MKSNVIRVLAIGMVSVILLVSNGSQAEDDEVKESPSIAAVLPAVDGMLLRLKENQWQQVHIRVKSLGIGFCRVDTRLDGISNAIPAPPGGWGGWTPIGPAFTGGTYELRFETCSAGALGQVAFVSDDDLLMQDRAGKCTGDACDALEIRKRAGCIELHNVSGTPIHVKPDAAFVSFDWIYARSHFVPEYGWPPDTHCLSQYDYDHTATTKYPTPELLEEANE